MPQYALVSVTAQVLRGKGRAEDTKAATTGSCNGEDSGPIQVVLFRQKQEISSVDDCARFSVGGLRAQNKVRGVCSKDKGFG